MDKEYAKYLLEKTQKDYNLIAEDFSRTRWNIWYEFSIFRDYVKNGDNVLDIGCGNGRLLDLLAGKKINYFGFDSSDKLIEIAKKKYPDKHFVVANALRPPFPDNHFDVVFLIALLHNIPSEELRLQVLNEAKRVLKPRRFLILTVWDIWRKQHLLLILKHLFLKIIKKSKLDFKDVFLPWGEKTNRYYHFFTKRELCQLVRKNNLEIKKTGIVKNEAGKRSNLYLIAQKPL